MTETSAPTAAPKAKEPKEHIAKQVSGRAAAAQVEASKEHAKGEAAALAQPSKIGEAGPGDISGSGAIVEPGALKEIDVDHPAVDNNPRRDTTVAQNQIDFNDPTAGAHEAVQEMLDR